MKMPRNVNPGGGEILSCAEDAGCEITSCEMCMKEIPVSAALNEEGADYIHHFCGLDCLETWRLKARQEFHPTTAA